MDEKTISLNEEDTIRKYFARKGYHLKRRTLWRRTPEEAAEFYGVDPDEIRRAAGRYVTPKDADGQAG